MIAKISIFINLTSVIISLFFYKSSLFQVRF